MKTENWIKSGIVLSVIIFAFAACSNSKYPGYKEAENGVYIKYHKKGEETTKPQLNDIVTVDMIYGLGDTTLFNSSEQPQPISFPILESSFKGDLYAALTLLNIGDSVSVAFPADSFFMVMAGMPKSPEFVKPNATIYFDIKLVSFVSQAEKQAEQTAMLLKMKDEESVILQKYLADNNITTQPLASGLYFIEEKKGSGPAPKVGDVMQVNFSVSLIEGGQLYTTFDKEPMDIEFGQPFDTKGFDEALGYLRKGSKANLIVPSSIAFDSVGRSQMIPPYSTMLYTVELVNIRDKAVVEKEKEAKRKLAENAAENAKMNEKKIFDNYIKANSITVAPTASGMYYIETEKGTGATPENGKKVKVHYTLYNIEGKKLQSSKDSGQPFTFTLGQGEVIKGWDEGLLLMKAGGKARLVIPSALAYGETARGADIPAYSPLVFDVELLEVIE